MWSLGVVLYICLCGFPPFSDELWSEEHPYNLSQQIKMGRFDYPSPYWDSIGDPALDLIDRMLTVDSEKRITVNECLEHPWMRNQALFAPAVTDSTDGLTGAMDQLDFRKRKVERERTLLSNMNSVKVSQVIEAGNEQVQVKVFEKNADGKLHKGGKLGADTNGKKDVTAAQKKSSEPKPDAGQQAQVFMELGGKGDQALFGHDADSRYNPGEVP